MARPSRPAGEDRAAGIVPTVTPPPDGRALVDAVRPERLKADVERLAAFGTRHTLSDATAATRGIGAAYRFLEASFEQVARESGRTGPRAVTVRLDRSTQPADGKRVIRDVELVNVVATLPGDLPEASARTYVVVGHYDSRATDVLDATSDAPGANDDASGVAVVLELARVLSRMRLDSTVVLLATPGEEQGLLGARAFAKAARADKLDIRAVLNDDIVGDPTSPTGPPSPGLVRVFSEALPEGLGASADRVLAEARTSASENDGPSRELGRFIAQVAQWEGADVQPMLVSRVDRLLRGGDQMAFAEFGYPGVRFTTVDETYTRQHQNVRVESGTRFGDTPDHVDAAYLAGVTRTNGLAILHLANAPAAPGEARVVVAGLANDTRLRWSPNREPDLAGYEVVWRETMSTRWEHCRDVGMATDVRLPMNRDNSFFGVRAYDRAGYRSPVAFARPAAE